MNYIRRTISAFSLIELLVVISLLGVLLTISIPFLGNFLQQPQSQVVQSQLLHALRLARNEAIARNSMVSVIRNDEGWLVFKDPQAAGVVQDKTAVLAVMQSPMLGGKLHFRAFPVGRHSLQFSPSGEMQNENATFWYCARGATSPEWAVVINRLGRVRVAYPDKRGMIMDSKGNKLLC